MVFWWLRTLRSWTSWMYLAVAIIMFCLFWPMAGMVPACWDCRPQSQLQPALRGHEAGWQLKKWLLTDSTHEIDLFQSRPSACLKENMKRLAPGRKWQRHSKTRRQRWELLIQPPYPLGHPTPSLFKWGLLAPPWVKIQGWGKGFTFLSSLDDSDMKHSKSTVPDAVLHPEFRGESVGRGSGEWIRWPRLHPPITQECWGDSDQD